MPDSSTRLVRCSKVNSESAVVTLRFQQLGVPLSHSDITAREGNVTHHVTDGNLRKAAAKAELQYCKYIFALGADTSQMGTDICNIHTYAHA